MKSRELIFKSVTVNSTKPAEVWKPNKGKRIRMIGYRIHAVGTISHERILLAELMQDGKSLPFRQLLPISNVKDTGSQSLPVIELGRGYLLEVDHSLQIRISDSLLHGFVDVLVWGREE